MRWKRLWMAFLVVTLAVAPSSLGQILHKLVLIDGPRMTFGLGTVWVWQKEDGNLGVRGLIPKLIEQERVVLVVQGNKGEGKKREKISEVGTVRGQVEIGGTFEGGLPLQVRLNYRKGDRIQTARAHRTFLVDELPEPGVAMLLTFRLDGEEEVEGTRELLGCEQLLTTLELGQGNGCLVPDPA